MSGVRLGSGGEFDRIRAIAASLGEVLGPIGDDTATVPPGKGKLVVSIDASVEGVHFRRGWMTLEEIGWRATAAALSDLAAAAAQPAGAVLALIAPRDAGENATVELMRGAGAAAASVGARILGGDLTAGDSWAVIVTVLGRVRQRMSRAGAHAGDGVWVTGRLGGALVALESWRAGDEPDAAAREAFVHPVPRVAAARWLAAHGATAMMDISDGLGGDVEHLAAASGVRLELDLGMVPRHPAIDALSRRLDREREVLAATGGEDYELLFTMPPTFTPPPAYGDETGVGITRIGVVVDGAGVEMKLHGTPRLVTGYRHWR